MAALNQAGGMDNIQRNDARNLWVAQQMNDRFTSEKTAASYNQDIHLTPPPGGWAGGFQTRRRDMEFTFKIIVLLKTSF
jgi:hypothetical protein